MIVFRLPFEDQFYTITETTSSTSTVEFHTFLEDEKVCFKGELKSLSIDELQKLEFTLPKFEGLVYEDESHDTYIHKIEKTIDCIKEKQLKKLVIARKKSMQFKQLSVASILENLKNKFPSAFIYFFLKNETCWMGAFSETLGIFDKKDSIFETMSLAGTLPINEEWSTKEIEEQKPVTNYIREILEKYDSAVEQSETFNHISGNIKHLRTDFKIKVEEHQVSKIFSELHPTPAVCGIPKEECKIYIHQLENFSREYYAGYSKIETAQKIYSFVNLRCGRFYENRAVLYAGGGITALSNPEKEWQETELKLAALGKNLIF